MEIKRLRCPALEIQNCEQAESLLHERNFL